MKWFRIIKAFMFNSNICTKWLLRLLESRLNIYEILKFNELSFTVNGFLPSSFLQLLLDDLHIKVLHLYLKVIKEHTDTRTTYNDKQKETKSVHNNCKLLPGFFVVNIWCLDHRIRTLIRITFFRWLLHNM